MFRSITVHGFLFLLLSITLSASANSPRIKQVVTEEKQSSMTSSMALKRLKEGNNRFLNDQMKQRNYVKQAKMSASNQFPWAVILNCMDSRSVPEILFDTGIADLFTLRVAGNVLSDDMLGSMEFATKLVGTQLIVVMGHTSCGAIHGACEGVTLGQLDVVLNKIKPAVEKTEKAMHSSDCANHELINAIAKANAQLVARQIRARSVIIRTLEKQGKVMIVPAMHDIKTGKITFFDSDK